MTQRFSFWEDLSIAENLDFVARMYFLPNRRRAVRETLERLGLAERRNQLAGQLSGGWKQRLALAACMIHEPQAAAARRADGRRGPQGPPRVLGGDPSARRRGTDVPDRHALHGRGRALPPARVHSQRPPAGPRHGRRSRRAGATCDLVGQRPGPARTRRATARQSRRGAGRALRQHAARQRRRRDGPRTSHRSVSHQSLTNGVTSIPAWKTYSFTSWSQSPEGGLS